MTSVPENEASGSLKEPEECERRAQLMELPHMEPLVKFLSDLRYHEFNKNIPSFDPLDGGVNARALFLLKSPGPGALKSGFVSRNNPDATARNFSELLKAAGIKREDTLIWNVVPWYIGDLKKGRSFEEAEIRRSLPYLEDLLKLLPNLKIIVLMGIQAQAAGLQIREMSNVSMVETFIPSARVFTAWKNKLSTVRTDFDRIEQVLHVRVPTVFPERVPGAALAELREAAIESGEDLMSAAIIAGHAAFGSLSAPSNLVEEIEVPAEASSLTEESESEVPTEANLQTADSN